MPLPISMSTSADGWRSWAGNRVGSVLSSRGTPTACCSARIVIPPSAEQFELHFRFLETADESFEYAPGELVPPQGRWAVSGIDLPPELLVAVYAGNARRILQL